MSASSEEDLRGVWGAFKKGDPLPASRKGQAIPQKYTTASSSPMRSEAYSEEYEDTYYVLQDTIQSISGQPKSSSSSFRSLSEAAKSKTESLAKTIISSGGRVSDFGSAQAHSEGTSFSTLPTGAPQFVPGEIIQPKPPSRTPSQEERAPYATVVGTEEIAASTGDSIFDINAYLSFLISQATGVSFINTSLTITAIKSAWGKIYPMLASMTNPTAVRLLAAGEKYVSMLASPIGAALPIAAATLGMYRILSSVYSMISGEAPSQQKEIEKQIWVDATKSVLPKNTTVPAFKGGSGNQGSIDNAYLAQAQGNIQRASRTQYNVRSGRGTAVARPLLSNVQITV